jgi:two-component system CheB/CheR fusion protein
MRDPGDPEKDPGANEERTRSVVDHVLDGIITIDERGDIESFNPAAERIFGYARAEVLGRNVKLLMPEPYHSEHDAYLGNYVSTGRPKIIGIGREVLGRRKDGATFPMDLAVSEFRSGARRHFTGIVRDITERKRLEAQLHERVKELADADRQKDEFLAMLSHELRNPLAPMRNALYLLRRAKDPETLQAACEVMERQMHQLVRLVDDLLDVSRIVRGKIDLRRERVDVGAIVARAVETAQPVVETHGHAVEVSLPEKPLQVEGDMVRLAQVLANLLTNAAKHTGGSERIDVIVRREGDDALISVRDKGVGIPAELLERIFDLFVQGEHTLARSQGGLGIGLTLAKRLVEMHGGSVAASSAGPGQGSEFSVRLPLAPASAPAGEAQPARPEASARAARKRLPVVDDNVDAAETIARLLRLAGYEADCVHDGPSALQAVERKHPDIVVLDIGLPGMDGYEVARRLRERDRDLPLIAVTGYGQDSDRKRSEQAGFDHHFTKPVDPLELESYIAKLSRSGSIH